MRRAALLAAVASLLIAAFAGDVRERTRSQPATEAPPGREITVVGRYPQYDGIVPPWAVGR